MFKTLLLIQGRTSRALLSDREQLKHVHGWNIAHTVSIRKKPLAKPPNQKTEQKRARKILSM